MKMGKLLRVGVLLGGSVAGAHTGSGEAYQLTHAAQGHVLTNINAWSPDGAWIVYDTRTGDGFNGETIERVRVTTGEVERLYTSRNGAHCGVVTYSPVDSQVVFILGPENPTPDWNYNFTRRRGVMVDSRHPGVARPLDAMNYAPPFVAGALRGGSHVHVFSPDGQGVSFTYEDEVLARLDADAAAPPHEPNQRNVGVTLLHTPVEVASTHPRNHDGDGFTVIVTRTVAEPRPGSDEISKAFEEGWVGDDGYLRADGSRQSRALAFQGLVTAADGRRHAEVFILDLPEDLTEAGEAPLSGTMTTRPAPPRGVIQRRLTFTTDCRHPGVAATPRHWLRAAPDGSVIAFLMLDDAGVVQLWTVPPTGGSPRQITHNRTDIASAFTWHPDSRRIAHVMDGSVCETDLASGTTVRLTPRTTGDHAPSAQACVYAPAGDAIAYTRMVEGFQQIFVVTTATKPETTKR